MIFNVSHKPKYMTDKDVEEFLRNCTNKMYKFAALIMLDTGARITEVCTMRIKQFNFPKKELWILSLKKRKDKKTGEKKEVWRMVSLTDRIIHAAADYFATLKNHDPDSYVFQSRIKKDVHVCREQFWKYYQKISDGRVYNHLMRHTCATNLMAEDVDILTVKEILGHSSIKFTEIYAHAKDEKKQEAAKALQRSVDSKLTRLLKKLFPFMYRVKNIHVLPTPVGYTKFHVGRKDEMVQMLDLIEKRVNFLLLGKQGFGKTHLLENLQGENFLRINTTTGFRTTLANTALRIIEGETPKYVKLETNEEADENMQRDGWTEVTTLVSDPKEMILQMLQIDKNKITSMSANSLCDLLIKLTQKGEYTLIIDNADACTPSVVKNLELLRNHFHIIAAARAVKLDAGTWLTNFQRIDLKPLSRTETVELINRASEDFRQRVQDFDLFKNHIIKKCGGNPQFSLEYIDRFRKENFVTNAMLSQIEHTAAKDEFSLAPFLLIGLALFLVLKYWSKEAMPSDKEAFAIFSACAIVLIMVGRNLRSTYKRKYI